MSAIQIVNVAPKIPASLNVLERLARNAWWAWNADATALFRRMDPNLWRDSGQNPLEFLRLFPQERLESFASDPAFLSQLNTVARRFEEAIRELPDPALGTVAYFSLEFGLHESIRLYAGGLGILAGDHLKAASDLGVPLMGVGLFYHQGYFEQRLNHEGWQQEQYPESEIENLPMRRARNRQGETFCVTLPLPEGTLHARVWQLNVGRVPLILLDANVGDNPPEFRRITARLYGDGPRNRLRQELLLAIGGFRALEAMGVEPSICHLNEGHAAFLSVARMEYLVKQHGMSLEAAMETVARSNVFTTHTPVPAGNETFPTDLLLPHLEVLERETGVPPHKILEWGRAPGDTSGELSMTVLGLRLAHHANAVSELHGDVARGMWQHVWPGKCREEIPIRHVTNGVHSPTWISPEMMALFQQYLGDDWETQAQTAKGQARLDEIQAEELWNAHEAARARLLRAVRQSVEKQLAQRNATKAELALARSVLDPQILTIAFARRAATYKRATLLLKYPERLMALLRHAERPVQFVFAGKAHPADEEGKKLLQVLSQFSRNSEVARRFVFVEGYDMSLARFLVQGADVWLNTPRRRQEASGTSGMKAALNGVLNASILDGWWCEGFAPDCGWAIGKGEEFSDDQYADDVEAAALYRLIEDDIATTFYERSHTERSRWIAMMRASIKMALGRFTSSRMVQEYREQFYKPAAACYRRLTAEHGKGAFELVGQRQRLEAQWHSVRLHTPKVNRELTALHVGDAFTATSSVYLGSLRPDEVRVELCFGPVDSQSRIRRHEFLPMAHAADHQNGWHDYTYEMPCPRSGRFGITTRIVPAGDTWGDSSPGFVVWAQQPT